MGQAMSGGTAGGAGSGPPPLPGQASYFVALDGKQSGPHPMDDLRQRAASGALTPETLVWKQGMAAWTPASQVDELSSLFAAAGPPPLPPA
jgi:hypothetical protein